MILHGDCLEHLVQMPDEHVQTCVTSPPYWGLRDYGTARWDGGDAACDHSAARLKSRFERGGLSAKQASNTGSDGDESRYARHCPCGAVRTDGQLGLEPTPDEYVANLVRVFREVRRVLKDDGTLWLNLGDTFYGGGNNRGTDKPLSKKQASNAGSGKPRGIGFKSATLPHPILKPKDLVGIPWRVAFALQADGWYLRQDIIWAKPNPMPESVRDRCTKAHEYIFLLSKQSKYYFDCDAMKEPAANAGKRISLGEKSFSKGQASGKNVARSGNALKDFYDVPEFRNRRSVWTVTTKPFKLAHFATFPCDLIEPCILAGSAFGDYVLDPFAGAGTVGLVCKNHGRKFIGIELNSEYAAMAEHRISGAV